MATVDDMTTRSPLRIVLAEDSMLLREGLVRLFDEAGFETVAAYGDADSLLAALDETRPDLAILDVRMPPTFRDEGVRGAIELRRRMPHVGVLLLSQYVEGTYAHELLSSGEGGMGYLLKDRVASLEELEDAVERVSQGGTVLDPQVVRELLARRSDPLASLTPREGEVLALMAEGRTNAGIAKELYIGVGAVEKNVTSIFQKLGLEDSGTDHRRVLAVLAWLQR
jgi:DNA-binding NarL/FixJ family response regulator